MTKEEANQIAKEIYKEWSKQVEEITQKAKRDGIWEKGLDSNRRLFKELDEKTKDKLRTLADMIDEE